MITFKTFLVEASSGAYKWEKYFSSGEVDTIAKNDATLSDPFGRPTKKTVVKGEKIKVLASTSYSPKLKVKIGKTEYLMKLTDIEKPIILDRTVRINLKPDKLGLFGAMTMKTYSKKVKNAIDSNSDIPAMQAEYLKALVDLAKDPNNSTFQFAAETTFYSSGTAEDQSLKNTINADFMEVLGPFFVIAEMPEYKDGGVKFPESGSEPLYDFTMKAERGDAVVPTSFSSKRSGGSTNTLKVSSVIEAVKANTGLARKFKKEVELLQIISDNSVKSAPDKINEWLAKNYSAYKIQKPTSDNIEIARLEAFVAKWINEESGLNFTPLIKASIPNLWYVRARLTTTGTIKVEPLKSGRDIEGVKLRSKSSPGHLADKLGFAV